MIQYLLNATAIWLISLVMFDLFLRMESYHNYNRFYLLFTFMLGALLPLSQWHDVPAFRHSAIPAPVEQVIHIKQTIISAGSDVSALAWQSWVTVIYMVGAVSMLLMLLADIYKLAAFYKSGIKSKDNDWTIVEAHKPTSPFSFFNVLFVNNRKMYDAAEWTMLLNHEKRHSKLFHFADLLLMQSARIVFWFHPLVHIYNRRLLLVHEYQADNISAPPKIYGQFLVGQAVLDAAPSIAHSFNRSPIKKRIVMLTRRSSFAGKTKAAVLIPVALVCVFCFSQNSFSQKFMRNGNYVTYKGNRIEISKPRLDTELLTDPVTGQEFTKYISTDPRPIRVNGYRYRCNPTNHLISQAMKRTCEHTCLRI